MRRHRGPPLGGRTRHHHRAAAVLTLAALVAQATGQVEPLSQEEVVAAFAARSPLEAGAVDCGGHYAETCSACPLDNGPMWCNGQCTWYRGGCVEHTWWTNLWYSLRISFEFWLRSVPVILGLAFAMLIYARLYKSWVVDEIPQEHIPNRWEGQAYWQERQFGLFECCTRPEQCLWATFCTPVVAAKNYHVGSAMGYWASCTCVFVGMFTFFWPFYCIMAAVRTGFSQKLARNLRLRPRFCKDFLVSLFCLPCDVGRESMEVDEALGVEIRCPFAVYASSMTAKVEMYEDKVLRNCGRNCSTY